MNITEERQFLKALANDYGKEELARDVADTEVERYIRAFMNTRGVEKMLPTSLIQMQDKYLDEKLLEKGVVELSDIETIGESLNSSNKFASKISVWQGDITRLKIDAIVNAANKAMLGCFVPNHKCIDNAIHYGAGLELRFACEKYMSEQRKTYGQNYEEPTGSATLTKAYKLPAKYVIHTVGPIALPRLNAKHKEDLKSCYESILELALDKGIRSLAFCCISTGEFAFPNEEAAKIAVETVNNFLEKYGESFDRIIFNVFKDVDKEIYKKLLKQL